MRTLLYVDDLLIACSSFEEASQARRIIEEKLLAADIVRAPLKGCFDTPLQTLTDHLGFSISTIGKGDLFVTLVTEVSLISRDPNLRFERISISRGFL
jgi:hypothetical protein